MGVVSALHDDTKQRPIVRVIRSSDGELLSQPYEVDLKRKLDLMISGLGTERPTTESRSNKVFHMA